MNFSKFFAGFFLGSLIVLAFQPFNYWFLTFLIPGLLYQLIKRESIKNVFFISYFFGFGLWAFGIFWIENSITVYGGASPILGGFLTLLLAAFLSLFQAFSFFVFKLVSSQRKTYEIYLLFPATWVLSEWLREFLFTGFPWLYIGYTAVDNTLIQGYIPVLGVFGIGFFIVFISQIILSLLGNLKDLLGIEHNIIQGANGILNGKVLRFKNEPVRHKTLDLIGDLALLGVPIKGHVTAARAGHASNVEFVKKLKKHYSKELENLRLCNDE